MLQDLSTVDGWLFDDEPQWLYEQACAADGIIIEIGNYCGKSTICLAQGSKDGYGHPVYSIDPSRRATYDVLRKNLQRLNVDDKVNLIINKSENATYMFAEMEAAFIFIDGAHDYVNCARDIDMYLPFLNCMGTVAIHDCNSVFPGVMLAYKDRILSVPDAWKKTGIRRTGSHIAWAQKRYPDEL
jgi:MMP 1-O-methyltransferase